MVAELAGSNGAETSRGAAPVGGARDRFARRVVVVGAETAGGAAAGLVGLAAVGDLAVAVLEAGVATIDDTVARVAAGSVDGGRLPVAVARAGGAAGNAVRGATAAGLVRLAAVFGQAVAVVPASIAFAGSDRKS